MNQMKYKVPTCFLSGLIVSHLNQNAPLFVRNLLFEGLSPGQRTQRSATLRSQVQSLNNGGIFVSAFTHFLGFYSS